jgi:hypothetical protein
MGALPPSPESSHLRTIPVVLDQFTPDLTRLPRFVLALANEVIQR